MVPAWIRRSALVALVGTLLVGACGARGPNEANAGPTATTPAPTQASTPAGTASPSAAASLPAEPPSVALAAEGGDPVMGKLGSYTWAGGGSDSPWLPGTPIRVGAGEPLAVSIGGGVGVVEWFARRIRAGTAVGTGAVGLGAGHAPVAFAAPGSGTWSVQVVIRFAGDLGSATYYWELTVP